MPLDRFLGTPRINVDSITLNTGYAVFLVGSCVLIYHYWPMKGQGENVELYLFGAIFAAAGGVAVTVSILTDWGGRLVMLLVPKAMKKARMDALRNYQYARDAWERRKADAEAKGEQFDEPQPVIESFA